VVWLVNLVKRRNTPLRLLLAAAACIPLAFVGIFYEHFYAHLTGNVIDRTIKEQWDVVLLSTLLFLACLVPLSFRRKVKWTEYGLVTAFFVSLFLEMYGIPFTILLAHKWFYGATTSYLANVVEFRFLGVNFGMDIPMVYAAAVMMTGALLVITGWITLYLGLKRKKLITNGIYSFSRHPQYLGFIMIVAGWLIGWPTMLTVILAPVLIFKYIRVARHEEKEVPDLIGYHNYKQSVPFLI